MKDVTIKMFVNGQWREGGSGDTMKVIDPGTGKSIGNLCLANEKDIEECLIGTQVGFNLWKSLPATKRAETIHRTADIIRNRSKEIAQICTKEQGKPLSQSLDEMFITAEYLDELAECASQLHEKTQELVSGIIHRKISYEPLGPIYASSPWNYPAMMTGRKIATALAAGCSIVMKPSEKTPMTAIKIAECFLEAGVPDQVINVIFGHPSIISKLLIVSPVIRKVSFTGSTAIGRRLGGITGRELKKTTFELGGHAPVIVCSDVEVQEVARLLCINKHLNSGQSCIAPTRFYVHADIMKDFVTVFVRHAGELNIGYGLDEEVDMGPLIDKNRIAIMENFIQDAINKGCRLLYGGSSIPGPGFFFEPTVLVDVPDHARIMNEEPFGPISMINSFSHLDEVIESANQNPYGLAAYVFTKDSAKGKKIADRLEAGMVGINTMDIATTTVPFGGVKSSGYGRESTLEGVLECMYSRTISQGASS